jgi:hypothetical protein
VGWTLRWLSVGPEWSFEKSPHELNLTWAAGWASRSYNQNLVGRNNQAGFLGEFQPIIHYMTKSEFEALGDNIRPGDVPTWKQ